MLPSLFQAVLAVSLRFSVPLLFLPLLLPVLRKYFAAKTLLNLERLLMLGVLAALFLTFCGPLFTVFLPAAPPAPFSQISPHLPSFSEAVQGMPVPAPEIGMVQRMAPSLMMVLTVGWLTGSAALLGYSILQNVLFQRHLRQHRLPVPLGAAENLDRLRQELGIPPALSIWLLPDAVSPMLSGCLRPVILLPVQNLPAEPLELRLLLAHELCHYRARDNWWKLLQASFLVLFWFHPLVWLFALSLSAQCELACDEATLRETPSSGRTIYGRLLLRFSGAGQSGPLLPPGHSALKGDFHTMKLRIQQIASAAPKRTGGLLLCGWLVCLALAAGAVGVRRLEAQSPPSASSAEVPQSSSPEDTDIPVSDATVFRLEDNPSGHTREVQEIRHLPEQPFLPPLTTHTIFQRLTLLENNIPFSNQLYFFAPEGDETVVAGCDGVVVAIQTKSTPELTDEELRLGFLGKYVILDCGNGISVRYTYLDTVEVESGQQVKAGDPLGTAGNTGAGYGWFEQCGVIVMQDGLMVDPLAFFDVEIQLML